MDKFSRVGGVLADPTVKAVLEQFKEQIAGMQSGATWKEIASTQQAGAWTIPGCTPGKPLFIIAQGKSASRAYTYISSISGVVNVDTDSAGLYLVGGSDGNSSTNVAVFIPSSTTVAIYVSSSVSLIELHAYN